MFKCSFMNAGNDLISIFIKLLSDNIYYIYFWITYHFLCIKNVATKSIIINAIAYIYH